MSLVCRFITFSIATIYQLLSSCGTEVEAIPANYTGKLQLMDFSMNKPFKDGMWMCVEEFLVKNEVDIKTYLEECISLDYGMALGTMFFSIFENILTTEPEAIVQCKNLLQPTRGDKDMENHLTTSNSF